MSRRGLYALFASALLLHGCVHRKSPTAGRISSLEMVLRDPDPSALGSPQKPISAPHVVFDITAVDEQGAPIGHDVDVQVFLSFGGVKTGALAACGSDDSGNLPIATVHLPGGQVLNYGLDLPQAFGSATIWLDELTDHATGASPTIYFRNPYIAEVQTPPDVNAPNASFCSPFNGKFITFDETAMPTGKLVVSSVFGNAFTVTDTSYGDYAHFNTIYLYAFGKPPNYIVPGRVLSKFSGNISKFIGFTELNFPLFDATKDLADLPPPYALASADTSNLPKLISLDAGTVTLTGKECDPFPDNPTNDPNVQRTRDSWTKFNQFVLDGDGTCGTFTNFAVELPAKQLGTFDPLANREKMVQVTGMLRNNSGQNPVLDVNNMPISCDATNPCVKGNCVEGQCVKNPFNFWTIVPRTPADVVVQ